MMRKHSLPKSLSVVCLLVLGAGCEQLPGKPALRVPAPTLDTAAGFTAFYADRCAGCHGVDGTHGPARPLRDGAYLASIPEVSLLAILRDGESGTRMPGFGGTAITGVSDDALRAFIAGLKTAWMPKTAQPSAVPWLQASITGDVALGEKLFADHCASCHTNTSNIQDPFYLRLVSDQHLRTSIVFGRSDLGMPGAAGPFQASDGAKVNAVLSANDVDALVAFLAKQRTLPLVAAKTKGTSR